MFDICANHLVVWAVCFGMVFVRENYSGDPDQYLLAPEPMKFTWKPRW